MKTAWATLADDHKNDPGTQAYALDAADMYQEMEKHAQEKFCEGQRAHFCNLPKFFFLGLNHCSLESLEAGLNHGSNQGYHWQCCGSNQNHPTVLDMARGGKKGGKKGEVGGSGFTRHDTTRHDTGKKSPIVHLWLCLQMCLSCKVEVPGKLKPRTPLRTSTSARQKCETKKQARIQNKERTRKLQNRK
ncbi:hypothetical protein C8R45DRAFT_933054 [Mycena sanguinolenta]|nr:hypothetical protein C8R45DRAFT_933054 [Mycena sanguinolenta]